MYRYRDNSDCTRLSTDRASKHLSQIGSIIRVEGKRWRGKYGDGEAIMVTGSLGTMRLSGFLWGYAGEGPRGLVAFLKVLGVPEPLAKRTAFETHRLEDTGVDWTLTHGVTKWALDYQLPLIED